MKKKTKRQLEKELMREVDLFKDKVHLEAQRFMNKVFDIMWEKEDKK
jgi:hypothetical protein